VLVRGAQVRPRPTCAARFTRFEQAILVVAQHAAGPDATKDLEYAAAFGATRHQIAHEVHTVRAGPLNGLEQALELVRTAVNVADEDASRGHGPMFGFRRALWQAALGCRAASFHSC